MAKDPSKAVMLIVWTSGGAMLHSVLNDSIRPIGSESELAYIRANLDARGIPWDETTAANDDISGFGVQSDIGTWLDRFAASDKVLDAIADRVAAKLAAK